jgi:hypothetical protein
MHDSLAAALLPMTGLAFLLFTFYMVTDPGTTPVRVRSQVAFGAGVAVAYGVLTALHVVFGLFFALVIVSSVRGLSLIALGLAPEARVRLPRLARVPRPGIGAAPRRSP